MPLKLREVAGPTEFERVEHHRLDILSRSLCPNYVLQRCNHGHKLTRDEMRRDSKRLCHCARVIQRSDQDLELVSVLHEGGDKQKNFGLHSGPILDW